MILRDYQNKAVHRAKVSFSEGHRRILIQSPTGSGKGVILTYVMKSALEKGKSVMFLVHTREVINQIRVHLSNEDLDPVVLMANSGGGAKWTESSRLFLATQQTLHVRAIRNNKIPLPPADVIIVDECHRAGSRTYKEILDQYPDAVVMGFTATPVRKNGHRLSEMFSDMIQVISVQELIDSGFLVKPQYLCPTIPDLTGVKSVGGDYVEGDLEAVMNTETLVGDIIKHFKKHAVNRKTIVFTSGVAHSIHLRDEFNKAGFTAAHIDGETSKAERAELVALFRAGKIQILCNCMVFTEGFDVPSCDCVIYARPTKSLLMYLQMGGRGLRTFEGKEDCLIIDHAGNVFRHGPLEEDRDWQLEENQSIHEKDFAAREEKPKKTEVVCPECGALHKPRRECPNCGHIHQTTPRAVETLMGELVPLTKAQINKIRGKNAIPRDRFWKKSLFQCAYRGLLVKNAVGMYKKQFGVWPRKESVGDDWMPKGKAQYNMPAAKFPPVKAGMERRADKSMELYGRRLTRSAP